MLCNMNHHYKKNVCNNCGMSGHMFYNCKKPIMSFGIVCYRFNKNKIEYLMIRRKDSLGYVDFLRGKFNQYNEYQLKNIIEEMTSYEKDSIIRDDYNVLWNRLWNKKNEKYDKKIQDKINYVKENKKHLLLNDKYNWDEPEWGFPKGRRNIRENDFECSLREFEEETGYSRDKLVIMKNMGYFEEVFTGSNLKSYKHKYYLCKISMNDSIDEDKFQKSEIGALKWMGICQCLALIRDYNTEKKKMLVKIDNILNNNIYSHDGKS